MTCECVFVIVTPVFVCLYSSHLPAGVSCLLRDVLLDILEGHFHTTCYTMQKGNANVLLKRIYVTLFNTEDQRSTWGWCLAVVSAVVLGQAKVRDGGEARRSKTNPGWNCKKTAHLHTSTIWRYSRKKSVYYTYRVYILILLRLSREPRDVWEGKDNMIGVFQLEPPSRTISQWISFISADCSDQV